MYLNTANISVCWKLYCQVFPTFLQLVPQLNTSYHTTMLSELTLETLTFQNATIFLTKSNENSLLKTRQLLLLWQ